MFGKDRQESFEKLPASVVVVVVMGQQAGGFVRVGATGSPGLEVFYDVADGLVLAAKARSRLPVDDVAVSVDRRSPSAGEAVVRGPKVETAL
ncbi:MAG: hypothetical protein M5U09_20205 [Gammaproteobacteria bacterium]|nr:hypothetical protein [Gammaproteobacteria bacterium]